RRRRAQDLEFPGEFVGETLDDDGIAAEWQMRTMLLAGPDRHDEPRVRLDGDHDFVRSHLLDAQRTGSRFRLSHLSAVQTSDPAARAPDGRGAGWIVASSIALLATSRWLSATAIEYLLLAVFATVVAGAAGRGVPRAHRRWAA